LKKYSREMIGRVLASCDIVDVIGEHVELKDSGNHRFKGLSPFTNEKTPSFMVSRDRQMYYCFSSGQGGDVLHFLMELEGLSFNEALQKLADRAGVVLESSGRSDNRDDYLRRRLLELHTFAARFFTRQLQEPGSGANAQAYLQGRKLQSATSAHFGLGFAADSFNLLRDAAFKEGFRESELMAAGLVRRGDRSLYDFFRNRLMIPIRDVSGNVVAFGGRDLGDSPAKYINSPESIIYNKSQVLYGLHECRDGLRKKGCAVLVEGYFDLMRCFDAGFNYCLATCGTALTFQQAMLIKRYAQEVVVVYDGDAAGIRAALRGISLLLDAGLTVRALTLPDAKDPDDYIRDEGADAFASRLENAKDFVSYYIAMNRDQLETIEGRTEVAQNLFGLLRSMDEPLRVDQYLHRIASGLNIHIWECKRAFEDYWRNQRGPTRMTRVSSSKDAGAASSKPTKDHVDFIAALMFYPDLHVSVLELLDEIESDLPAFILAGRLCRSADTDLLMSELDTEAEQALFAAASVVDKMDEERAHFIVNELVIRFRQNAWNAEIQRLHQQLQEAQRDQDTARTTSLYDRIVTLKRNIEALSTQQQ
jgi:DNA primase